MKTDDINVKTRVWNLLFEVLGLTKKNDSDSLEIPIEIKVLIEKRTKAKEEKNYQLADQIKNEVNQLGFELVDTRNGTEIKCLKK